RALMDALGQSAVPQLQLRPETAPAAYPTATALPGVLAGGSYPTRWIPDEARRSDVRSDDRVIGDLDVRSGDRAIGDLHRPSPDRPIADSIKPLIPLGQFRDTFIIAVDADGIAIIDQHVAHERVLFERVMEKLSAGHLESQRLLEPLLVELSPEGRQALLNHAADLDRLGFAVEDFGGDTLRMSAVPAILGRDEAVTALRALAEDLEGL